MSPHTDFWNSLTQQLSLLYHNSFTLSANYQLNLQVQMFFDPKYKIMLFLTSSSHPTPTRMESAAKSPALILLQGPDQCLSLGQPGAEGPGLPAFTTVVKPRPSGQYLAILSEAPHRGPPAKL